MSKKLNDEGVAAAAAAKSADVQSATPAPASIDSGLIRMFKEGTVLEVHPSCVKSHESVGWKVSP